MRRIFLLMLWAAQATAADEPPVNYCHDADAAAEWDRLLAKHPADHGVVKLYGLRVGLCAMIDEGKIPLETGIALWEIERERVVVDKGAEDLKHSPQFDL